MLLSCGSHISQVISVLPTPRIATSCGMRRPARRRSIQLWRGTEAGAATGAGGGNVAAAGIGTGTAMAGAATGAGVGGTTAGAAVGTGAAAGGGVTGAATGGGSTGAGATTGAGVGTGTTSGAGLLAGLVTQPSGSSVGASSAGAGGGGAFLKKLNIERHFRWLLAVRRQTALHKHPTPRSQAPQRHHHDRLSRTRLIFCRQGTG